jgi:hypothetical protein
MDVVTWPSDRPSGASGCAAASAAARGGVIFPSLITLVFLAAVATVAVHHEPWFDEVQAWLIGRDSSLWELLAHRVRYEGSPGLWHAILWGLSRTGLPFNHLWAVGVAFAGAGAWIVLRYAPFPVWLRIAVVFSYFFAYQYAVVPRSYSLALVLMPLAAVTFAHRLRRPLLHCGVLGLLANTSAHTFMVAAVLFADLAWASWRTDRWRDRRSLAAAMLFAAFAAAAVLQAWPPADTGFGTQADASRIVTLLAASFIDRLDLFAATPPASISIVGGAALSLVLLIPSGLLLACAGRLALVVTIAVALLAFSSLKHANLWHGGLLYLTWIFGLWVSWHAVAALAAPIGRSVLASVAAIVLVNDVYGVSAGWRDIAEAYSSGPAAARLLASRRDGGIAAAGFKSFSIQPWFDRNLFANYHLGAPRPAYLDWMPAEVIRHNDRPELWRALATSGHADTLVLSTWLLSPEVLADYVRAATEAGFCPPDSLSGGLIWKSYVYERDDLLIFRRCP